MNVFLKCGVNLAYNTQFFIPPVSVASQLMLKLPLKMC